MHFGGMTREEYLKSRPAAEADGQASEVYAPPILDVIGGESTARQAAILGFQTGDSSRPMNLHFAADATVLRKLIAVAQSRLAELERSRRRTGETRSLIGPGSMRTGAGRPSLTNCGKFFWVAMPGKKSGSSATVSGSSLSG